MSGTIRFRKPGATSFITLGAADQALPLGSTLDTTHGVMELCSVPKAGAAAQTSRFYAGQFKVTQPGGVTQLALTQPLAAVPRRLGGGQEAAQPQAVGQRPGLVPRQRPLQLGHRARHQVARAGLLRRHADPGGQRRVSVSDKVRHKTVLAARRASSTWRAPKR